MEIFDLGRRRRIERQAAGQELVEQHAERVDVGARVDLFGADLLGRHVRGRAHAQAGRRQIGAAEGVVDQLGDAEVEQLEAEPASARHAHHVRRLEISVHDADAVRGGERRSEVLHDREHVGDRNRAALAQLLLEVATLQPFHDEVGTPVWKVAELVDVDNVGMVNQVHRLGFLREPLQHDRRRRELAVQDLERGHALQRLVARAIDRGETATRTQALDDVVADLSAGAEVVGVQRLRRAGPAQRFVGPRRAVGVVRHRGHHSTASRR